MLSMIHLLSQQNPLPKKVLFFLGWVWIDTPRAHEPNPKKKVLEFKH